MHRARQFSSGLSSSPFSPFGWDITTRASHVVLVSHLGRTSVTGQVSGRGGGEADRRGRGPVCCRVCGLSLGRRAGHLACGSSDAPRPGGVLWDLQGPLLLDEGRCGAWSAVEPQLPVSGDLSQITRLWCGAPPIPLSPSAWLPPPPRGQFPSCRLGKLVCFHQVSRRDPAPPWLTTWEHLLGDVSCGSGLRMLGGHRADLRLCPSGAAGVGGRAHSQALAAGRSLGGRPGWDQEQQG